LAKEGSKTVPLAGLDDKHQITTVFGATTDGLVFTISKVKLTLAYHRHTFQVIGTVCYTHPKSLGK